MYIFYFCICVFVCMRINLCVETNIVLPNEHTNYIPVHHSFITVFNHVHRPEIFRHTSVTPSATHFFFQYVLL